LNGLTRRAVQLHKHRVTIVIIYDTGFQIVTVVVVLNDHVLWVVGVYTV